MLTCGAAAWTSGALGVVEVLLSEPIPVMRSGGRHSLRPLWEHEDLFYPDSVLGYANLGMQQLLGQYDAAGPLANVFHSSEEYQNALAQFTILVAMCGAREGQRPHYPGYRLIPGVRRAYAELVAYARAERRPFMAHLFGTSEVELDSEWKRRAEVVNTGELGQGFRPAPMQALVPTDLATPEV